MLRSSQKHRLGKYGYMIPDISLWISVSQDFLQEKASKSPYVH